MISPESAWLKERLGKDFPRDYLDLCPLCINEVGFPVGYYHIDILLDLVVADLPNNLLNDLRAPYIYLSAYYFCLDSIVDEHIKSVDNALFLTHLLSAAIHQFTRLYTCHFPNLLDDFEQILNNRISANARAVRSEIIYRSTPLIPNETDEYESIIGRSNSFLLLLDILNQITHTQIPKNIQKLIQDFLYFMQLGDDLGDWRIDFRSHRWTSFLRGCFSKIGQIPTEEDLERLIYLGGSYEHQASKILRGFDSILEELANNEQVIRQKFYVFVKSQRDRLYQVLRSFVEEKVAWANH